MPTTHTNGLELYISFFKLMRKLRLRHFFENVLQDRSAPAEDPLKGLKVRSTYMTPKSHKSLDMFESLVKQDMMKLNFHKNLNGIISQRKNTES